MALVANINVKCIHLSVFNVAATHWYSINPNVCM